MEEFISNIPGNGKFLYSSFEHYTNQDILSFLKEQKVEVKEERGNRVFPVSDKSMDVLEAFIQKLKQEKVRIKTNAQVKEILVEKKKVVGVLLQEGTIERADKVILATGGKSYPSTGSTGEGHEMAKKLGHTITELKPSLVPFVARGQSLSLCKEMQGLSLRNVAIKIEDSQKKKVIYEDFGEMLFTHFGISGPIILSGSAHLLRYKAVQEKMKEGNIVVNIDLKPALSMEKLDKRLQRDFEKYKNKEIRNGLQDLLPQKMILPVLALANIKKEKQIHSITREERVKLMSTIKRFPITIADFRPIEEAIVTAGGISIKEINPKTMESKLIEGLYFAGEIMDVDAYTGGFNLQIAYSTGYTAGKNF